MHYAVDRAHQRLTYAPPSTAARAARLLVVGAFLLAGILERPPLAAQGNTRTPPGARALLAEAASLLAVGDTASAIARLQAATEVAPDFSEAHYRYGMLLVRTANNDLGDLFHRRRAGRALDRALALDPGNPQVLLEIARLKLKQPFLRLEAQRLFQRALEAAEQRGEPAVVAEVRAEIGDIYHRRYQAQEHRRLITGPALQFDVAEALTDPKYTGHFLTTQTAEIPDPGDLDLRTAEEHYRAGVSAFPAHEGAAAGLLGILFDRGRYEEYHEAARGFAAAAPRSAKAHLLLGLGLWRLHRNREAARAFDRGLALLTPAEKATLTDISHVLRRAQAADYGALAGAERAEYERQFWVLADPLRLTEENEHRLEHLARLAYTDLRYSAPDLNLRGWQTDRGAIYTRYGPPPVIATFPPDTRATSSSAFNVIPDREEGITPDVPTVGQVVTVWSYPERSLNFIFTGPPGFNYARFAGEFQAYAREARYRVPATYDNVPVNRALDSVPVQTAAFRRPGGEADVVFFAGIPVSTMVAGTDLQRGQLETGFFVSGAALEDVVVRRDREAVDFLASRQFEARTFEAALAPGQYVYRVEARQPVTGRAARGMAVLAVEDLSRDALLLSDVVLANRVEPRTDTVAGRRDFFLLPNPAMTFAPGQPVHLYWEVYGLAADTAGVVRYDVEVTIRIQSLERHGMTARILGGVLDAVGLTAAGDERLGLSYSREQRLAGDRMPEHLAIDLQDAPSGEYALSVAVTDQHTGESFVRHRTFRITESPDSR